MIRHIVLLRFKPETPPGEVAACMTAFAALPSKIAGITAFESGADISPEGLAKGFSHVAVVTFADAAARDAYLPHPAHEAFVAQLKPWLDDVLVFDYALTAGAVHG